MDRLNLVSFIFLVVLFVLMPRAALRSARELRRAFADGTPPPRLRMALSTLFALTIIWFLSQMNAQMMGRSLFAVGTIGLREVGLGAIALAILLLAIPVTRAMRDPGDTHKRLMYALAPRTAKEFGVFVIVALAAGVAEESAYRGVAIWILQPILGSLIPAAFLAAMSFAVTHAVQGGKTMVVIFGMAIVFHALVYLTNTLVVAMVVHVVYDCIAALVAGKLAREFAAQDAATAATATSS